MTTHVLTPNEPDPLTGLQNALVGWRLVRAAALDVLDGMDLIAALGYGHRLETVDITISPPIYQLVINRAADGHSVTVNDTDWLVANEHTAWAISESDVTTKYTVTQQN